MAHLRDKVSYGQKVAAVTGQAQKLRNIGAVVLNENLGRGSFLYPQIFVNKITECHSTDNPTIGFPSIHQADISLQEMV